MTHSSISCLLSIIQNLKPDEKLFLVFLLFTAEKTSNPGNFSVIDENGVQLGKRFGFTKEASFRALHKLRNQGLIEETTDQGRLGRPRKMRKIIARGWESGETKRNTFQARLASPCLKLIGHRLKYVGHAGMNNTLFMLLLILTIKADRAGIVAEVSHADLSNYSGIPKSQIQRRIGQLQELGLIAEIIPGLVEGAILGKPNSIYYLNLNHRTFENTGMGAEKIAVRGKGCASTEVDQLVMKLGNPGINDRLASVTHHASTPPNIKMTQISPGSWVTNAPDALRRPAAKMYIQCAIERYASALLGNPNSILSEQEWRQAQDHATEEFVRTLTGRRPHAVTTSSEYRRMFFSLCADLEELAHQLASLCLQLGNLPKRSGSTDAKNIAYRILPSGTGKRAEIRLERIKLGT